MFRSGAGIAPWTALRLFTEQRCPTVQISRIIQRRWVQHDVAKTRNLAVVAHIDSGKTTLTESILFTSNYIATPGSVDTGSTTTDFLPAERERGITIQSASIPITWKEWNLSLIDTPGHADFGMEVESASRVVDGAVVLIDAVEGVEAQTHGVWNQLDRYKVPSRLLFLNKLDRPGASVSSSILSVLSHRLHPCPLPVTLPIASFDNQPYKSAEPGLDGVVDLIKWEVWSRPAGGEVKNVKLPRSNNYQSEQEIFPPEHPLIRELVNARTSMLDTLSMHSEELMNLLLSGPSELPGYLGVDSEAVISALRSATLRGQVLPVLCGSALNHIGTETVLDYAGHLLASPADVALVPQDDGPVQMLAWKVSWDARRGWMTFVRIYSGTLRRQAALLNSTRGVKEKAHKLLLLHANQPEEVDMLTFGSVGVVLGFKHTRTGDTLTSVNHPDAKRGSSQLPDISLPPAVMSLSILPQSSSDTQAVQDALLALSRTDPSARVEITDGQILVHGLGALHLEIIENRLRDEWNVRFETGRRYVAYKEGFGQESVDIKESWEGAAGGKVVTASLHISVNSLGESPGDPQWDGNVVVDNNEKPLPLPDSPGPSHLTYISQGISSILSNSPHTSLPLSQLHVQVHQFSVSDESNAVILGRATSNILRKALLNAGRGPILEPYITLNISVSEEHAGNVIKDITENYGVIQDLADGSSSSEDSLPMSSEGLYIPPSWISPSAMGGTGSGRGARQKREVRATAPLHRMLDFATRLRSLTAGHGTFEMSNAYFHVATPERQMEILKELGRV